MPTSLPTSGEYVRLRMDVDEISLPDHDTRFDPSIVKLSADEWGRTLAVLISYQPKGGEIGRSNTVAMLYFIEEGGNIVNKIYIDNATYINSYIFISPDAEWVIYEKRSGDAGNEVTVSKVDGSLEYKFKPRDSYKVITVSEDASWILGFIGENAEEGGVLFNPAGRF